MEDIKNKNLMDRGWADMESRLDVALPQKKKRRLFIIWFMGFLSGGLLLYLLFQINKLSTIESDHINIVKNEYNNTQHDSKKMSNKSAPSITTDNISDYNKIKTESITAADATNKTVIGSSNFNQPQKTEAPIFDISTSQGDFETDITQSDVRSNSENKQMKIKSSLSMDQVGIEVVYDHLDKSHSTLEKEENTLASLRRTITNPNFLNTLSHYLSYDRDSHLYFNDIIPTDDKSVTRNNSFFVFGHYGVSNLAMLNKTYDIGIGKRFNLNKKLYIQPMISYQREDVKSGYQLENGDLSNYHADLADGYANTPNQGFNNALGYPYNINYSASLIGIGSDLGYCINKTFEFYTGLLYLNTIKSNKNEIIENLNAPVTVPAKTDASEGFSLKSKFDLRYKIGSKLNFSKKIGMEVDLLGNIIPGVTVYNGTEKKFNLNKLYFRVGLQYSFY